MKFVQKGKVMRKIRRLEALGAAMLLAVAVVGCSGDKNEDTGSQEQESTAVEAVEEVVEEAPTVESLMEDVQESLSDVTSLRTVETIDFNSILSIEDESMDLGMKFNLDYQMISEPEVSGYFVMDMTITSEALSETYSSETYIEQDGDKLISYFTEDGTNFEIEEEDLSDYDMSTLMDDSLYASIGKGDIEAALGEDTESVNGSEAYVLEMNLSGDQFRNVMENSFSELEDGEMLPEDMDWDSVTAPTVLYIDKETKLPVKLTMDCSALGSALIGSMIGEELVEQVNLEVSGFDLIAEYSDYNALTPIAVPEAAKSGAVIEEEGDDGLDDGDDSEYQSITEGSLTMTDGTMTAVVEVPEGFDNLMQNDQQYISGFSDDADVFYAFSDWDVAEYLEYESDVEWMIESDSYADVTVSEVKTKTIGDFTVSYLVVEYTYAESMYCTDVKSITDLGDERLTVDFDSYSFDEAAAFDESIIDKVYAAVTIQ